MTEKLKYHLINTMWQTTVVSLTMLLFNVGGILLIEEITPLASYVMKLPLYVFMVYIILMLLIKDLKVFYRLFMSYTIISLIFVNFCSSYFLMHVAIDQGGYIGIAIFAFMGLFYGAFLWDIFVGGIYKDITTVKYQDKLKKLSQSSNDGVVLVDAHYLEFKSVFDDNNKTTSKLGIISLIFALPFALFGKSVAYFLTIGLSQYFDAHAYIVAAFGLSLFLYMIKTFLFMFIGFWKLKYPYELET